MKPILLSFLVACFSLLSSNAWSGLAEDSIAFYDQQDYAKRLMRYTDCDALYEDISDYLSSPPANGPAIGDSPIQWAVRYEARTGFEEHACEDITFS